MGGVVPRAPWSRTYEVFTEGWYQKLEATVDPSRSCVVIMSTVHSHGTARDHPFRHIEGVKISSLDPVDLGQAIAEVDRVLKPTRRWLVLKVYLPTIRIVYPRGGRNRHELGLVIANPAEQKKLLSFFRDALAVVAGLD